MGSTTVEQFFGAYDTMVRKKWPTPVGSGGETEFSTLFSIRPGVLTADDLQRHEARVGRLPESYKSFLRARSFRELDLEPWLSFPSSDHGGLAQLAAAKRAVGEGLAPFAMDTSTGGVFVFDNRHSGEPPIGIWAREYGRPGSVVERDVVLSPLATSFEVLLRVLTRVLMADQLLWVRQGQAPSSEQLRLAQEIRNIDPNGFGGVGWTLWWGWHAVNFPT